MSGIIGVSPDMKSGVVGKFPAGHVAQYFRGAVNTTMRETGNVKLEVFTTGGSITPKFTGSRIVVRVDIVNLSSSDLDNTIRISLTDDAATERVVLVTHFGYKWFTAGSAAPGRWHFGATHDMGTIAVAGTSIPFNVEIMNNNGSSNIKCNHDNNPSTLWLMEITQ
jgi:hypothetical protein